MSGLLALGALIVAVNPPRRVLELDPRPRPGVATVAGVGVLVAIVACAALAGPLLGGLDVSAPTFRVSAGFVVAVRGLVDVVRAPRPEPEGLGGWGEALVPVGFPVLLRPEVAIVAVAVGADLGVATTALVGAVAVGLAVAALVAWPGRRLAGAGGRVVSVTAMAVGIALVADGVLDI